jgi:hypothetical protein
MRLTPRVSSIATVGCVLVLAGIGPAIRTVAAQPAPVISIDPGMTRDEVIARLGRPSSQSHFASFTYMFYENGCQSCGIDDVVVLDKDIVTDAIFRSPKRTFTGLSSSPQGLPPVPSNHFTPEPIRASTPEDSAHRGAIVFGEPRAPVQAPRYTRIVPNRADSARMAAGSSTTATPHATDSTTPPQPH